jgi:hypothetical protein
MKTVEKSFEMSEKENDVKAKVARGERCKRVWRLSEMAMNRGIAANEEFADDVVDAAEEAAASLSRTSNATSGDATARKEKFLVTSDLARTTLESVYANTIALMTAFEKVDLKLNDAEYDVSVASAKLKGDKPDFLLRLEREKGVEDKRLAEEGAQKYEAVQDALREDLGRLGRVVGNVGSLGGVTPGAETPGGDDDAKRRMEKALEEARRRNGDV